MFDAEKIRTQIEGAAREAMELSPEDARDIAIHMTDWLDDLHSYVKFCENPNGTDLETVNEMLLKFLTHAPNHLAAAAKLYADAPVSDIFGVGAVEPRRPSGL